jgi:hypothetical protein
MQVGGLEGWRIRGLAEHPDFQYHERLTANAVYILFLL